MILHHELLQTAGYSLLSVLSWGCLGISAAGYYARRAWDLLRRKR